MHDRYASHRAIPPFYVSAILAACLVVVDPVGDHCTKDGIPEQVWMGGGRSLHQQRIVDGEWGYLAVLILANVV